MPTMQCMEDLSHGKGPEEYGHTRLLESDGISESESDHNEEEFSSSETLVDEANSFQATYSSVFLSQFFDLPITPIDPFKNCQGNPRLELLLQCSGKLELWLYPLMKYQPEIEYSRLKDPLEELNRMFPGPRDRSCLKYLADDLRNTMRKLNYFNNAFWVTSHEAGDPVLHEITNALMGCFQLVVRDLATIDPTSTPLFLLDCCRRRTRKLFQAALEYFYNYQRLEKSPDSILSHKRRFGKGHYLINLRAELNVFRQLIDRGSIEVLEYILTRATRRINKSVEVFLSQVEHVGLRVEETIRANAMVQMACSCGFVWTRKCMNIVKLLTMLKGNLLGWMFVIDEDMDQVAHYVWCIKHGISMLFARIAKHAILDEKFYTHAKHVDESCRALLAICKKCDRDLLNTDWCEEWEAVHECLQNFLDVDLCPVADRLREQVEQHDWL